MTEINIIQYIDYEDKDLLYSPLWYHKKGIMQTATGYGPKLTTVNKIRHNGRQYRVYASCFSNVASLYILTKQGKLYLR